MYAYHYSESSGINDITISIPVEHSLSQNFPNPFNASTSISYTINNPARVNLRIFDLCGREIKTLVDTYQHAHKYTVHLDASDLTSGMYYYQLQINNVVAGRNRMILSR